MFNLLVKGLIRGVKIAGKEMSKKAVIIGGSVAGAAVAGGTTIAVVHHHNKKVAAEAEATAPIEDAGAEKIEKAEADAPAAEAKEADVTAAPSEKIEKVEAEVVTPVAEEKTEVTTVVETPVAPVVDVVEEKKEETTTDVAATKEIVNPAPAGPNPAFAFLNNEQINQSTEGMIPNPMAIQHTMNGFMPNFMPTDMPIVRPEDQIDPKLETPEIVNDSDSDERFSAADVATGNVTKKHNKTKGGKK